MEHYSLDYPELALAERWECTMRIYKAKGFIPYKLDACCERMDIPLNTTKPSPTPSAAPTSTFGVKFDGTLFWCAAAIGRSYNL